MSTENQNLDNINDPENIGNNDQSQAQSQAQNSGLGGQATLPNRTPISQGEDVAVEGGTFATTLRRSNSKIREDRAVAISEDAEIVYRRKIEDLEHQHKKLVRSRENMLDLSPREATSLILATDFDAAGFTDKDLAIGVQLRELEIKLEIAKSRYNFLFGKRYA